MIQKPLTNSLLATLYISLISLLFYLGNTLKIEGQPILAPIALISLFTLSAAVMAYLFVYQPLVLYLDGKKKLAVNFFLKTVSIFALTTLILFSVLFFVIF